MGIVTNQMAEAGDLLRRASTSAQAGIFAGENPSNYNPGDPIRLWVIQIVIILVFTQVLSLALSRMRQPRVIAEVITGVLLGPSVMGRIPNFTQRIFPSQSIPLLNLTANIGLVLFLFLVGVEVDFGVARRNVKSSMIISAVGLFIPLGLGAALGIPLYHVFTDGSGDLGHFLLFVAVAVGITAFPVLCRILTELQLLETTVGVVVLAAGVGNDVIGWILLALAVALVNSGHGVTVVWVLLAAVGIVLFLTMPVRWVLRWYARRLGCLSTGQPTRYIMTIIIILVFISAFYTDAIGIHAIFGGFLAGIIIPKDNGFAIAVVEKLEDLVSILFVPLYFATSGLNTNLGLLDNGITWGYAVLICAVGFFSKFIGCAATARLCGFTYRESGAIGALMSCKGLVELIVLNIGLQAGVLNQRLFSMFVLQALVLTFSTTPLTILFYPAHKRKVSGAALDQEGEPEVLGGDASRPISLEQTYKDKFLVVLDSVEQLPSIMTFMQLLQGSSITPSPMSTSDTSDMSATIPKEGAPVGIPPNVSDVSNPPTQSGHSSVTALRLIELTDRTSAVLKSQHADKLFGSDHILNIFRTFGRLYGMTVSCALSVAEHEEFPSRVASHASQAAVQLVIISWSSCSVDGDGGGGLSTSTSSLSDGLFPQLQRHPMIPHTHYIRKVFAESPADVALFIDQNTPPPYDGQGGQHLFLPFFGGPDDRLALSFTAQLCMNPSITATVIRIHKSVTHDLSAVRTVQSISIDETKKSRPSFTSVHHHSYFQDTSYNLRDTQALAASEEADNAMWAQYTSPPTATDSAFARMTFKDEDSSQPLHAILAGVTDTIERTRLTHSRLLVIAGRSRNMKYDKKRDALHLELLGLCKERRTSLSTDVQKTLGDMAAAFVAANSNVSLLVMQACSGR
ncbi:hypothetical protein OBBRIDRAFT_831935 [Obba rivulosa]|uniref:Cation/H+ exchanger transmembrane domain-containing protein n=1 Tax=Obba rivulosa TaxID=1052685 RepID=A0A8E2J493_9APHY|nr:hypothetical protein OBBRIDRAFT_831935 [Obba rivulosa]